MLLGLIVLGAGLRLATLGQQSLWFDESGTQRIVVHTSLAHAWATVPLTENNPPLYYMLEWAMVHVSGPSEAGLRFLSAIAGIALLPVAYMIGGELKIRRLGLALAALAATSPVLVWYSQEARNYSLLVLFAALSLLWFLKAARSPTPPHLMGWLAFSALALCTHYLAVALVAPEALYLLVAGEFWLSAPAVFGVSVVGLGLLPLAVSQAHGASWIGQCCLTKRSLQVPGQLLAGLEPSSVLLVAATAIAIPALIYGLRTRQGRLLLALGCLAILLPLVLALGGKDYVLTRNLLIAWMPLAVVLAMGLTRLRFGLIGILILCAIGTGVVMAVNLNPRLQKPDMRSAAASLGPPRDRWVIAAGVFAGAVQAYRPGLRTATQGISANEVDVVSAPGTVTSATCWWGATCYIPMYRADRLNLPPGLHLLASQRFGKLEVDRLQSALPVHLDSSNVGNNYLLLEQAK